MVTNVWLSEWSNDFTANYTTLSQIEMDQQRNVRLGVYGALGCGQGKHGGMGHCDMDKVRYRSGNVWAHWDVDKVNMGCMEHWGVGNVNTWGLCGIGKMSHLRYGVVECGPD